MTRRKNPKIGKHPELFDEEHYASESDVVVEDWRELTPAELLKAAEAGALTDDDYAEMEEYEDEDTTPGDLPGGEYGELAQAIYDGLRKECMNLDEAGRERRAEPFIEHMREEMWGYLEMEYGDKDGDNIQNESYVDSFQSDIEHDTNIEALKTAATEVSDFASDVFDEGKLDDEHIEEVLRDPNNYSMRREDDSYTGVTGSGSVWSANCGVAENERDGFKYDKHNPLEKILFGGEYTHTAWGPAKEAHERGEPTEGLTGRATVETVTYLGMTNEDLHYALEQLDRDEPYIDVDVSGIRRGKHFSLNSSSTKERVQFTVDDFEDGYRLSSHFYESSRIHAIANAEAIDAALQAKLEEFGGQTTQVGPEYDDVVYRYAGTNQSVGGASARGMYVARLKPKDLRKEGSTQGICIGREENGHPKALREGRTQVYSIRTEAGKPKFTIELRKTLAPYVPAGSANQSVAAVEMDGKWWQVVEVKGKANRQPGFEAGKETFTKPDDLRLATDFLLSLGFSPEALKGVRDLAPGIEAAEESGMDPFSPPPKRVREHRDPRDPRTQGPKANPAGPGVRGRPSAAVVRLLAKTRPMGTFRA